MEFSKKRQDRAAGEKLDVYHVAVAELMAWGWDAADAMLAVGLIKESDTKIDAQHAAVNYTADEAFARLLKKRTAQLKGGSVLDEYQMIHPTPGSSRSRIGRPREDGGTRKEWQGELPEPVEDAEILAAMWETICRLDAGDPKRVDLLDKYDKLKRRQGEGGDDTTIHFYLPRPECDACPFRGDRIITDPEPGGEENAVRETDRDGTGKKPYNGKKRGRKPKKKPEDEILEIMPATGVTASDNEEPVELFVLEEEL